MNKTVLVILLAVVLGMGVLWARNRNSMVAPAATTMEAQPTAEQQEGAASGVMEAVVTPESTSGDAMTATNKVSFTVEGSQFKFTPNELKVKKGDTVEIVFKNSEGFHDWVLDEFNAKTKQISAGESETISFVADKTGTFEYYCSVGKHRQMGMVGNLIVE
jgi:plastocyanin